MVDLFVSSFPYNRVPRGMKEFIVFNAVDVFAFTTAICKVPHIILLCLSKIIEVDFVGLSLSNASYTVWFANVIKLVFFLYEEVLRFIFKMLYLKLI